MIELLCFIMAGPPSQEWRTFLRNHAPDIAAMDLFVVPTIGFDLLYALVIMRLDRRDLVWINVTANPTAEWVARQITEAFPWDGAPRYMIRDRDRIYGTVVTRRLRTIGIRDKPTAPASPWQNGFAERLIGSIRRECLDHVIVLGKAHMRRTLRSYACYYNEIRTHRSLNKDAPSSRPVQRTGVINSRAILGRTPSPLRPSLGFRYTQVNWAATEGWNPGLADDACFAAVDPEGFLIGEIDGAPAALAGTGAATIPRVGEVTHLAASRRVVANFPLIKELKFY